MFAGADGRRRFGVGPDVELRRRGPVADADGPAHEHDASRPDVGIALEERGDVRERACRHEHRFLVDRTGEEVDGPLLDRSGSRRWQRRAVESAVPVYVGGDGGVADERSRRAGGDGYVAAAAELEHLERVLGRLLKRLVPMHGRDASELDLRAR
jgi:hypothetical protein